MMMELEELPKGFRFRPTDEELVSHYLRLKINGRHSSVQVIPEVDVCKWEPWDLPALSAIKSDDPEWFFFWPRDRKYPNGHRSNRATESGYWKATGKDRTIKSRKSLAYGHSSIHSIGMKKTLVFYKGRAPKGERTNWVMHEYRATEPDLDGSGPGQGDYVLCRLFHKADENLDNSNYDEIQPPESSPSTSKSAPDDVSSDLFQQPAVHGMEILKELKDVKEQWMDGVDYLNPTNVVPADNCESSGVDRLVEKATMDVHAPLREIPMSVETNNNQLADKVFGTVQSYGFPDSGACISSPFADDFGYNPNGLHFQDGTSEQDVSLSELLEGLQNVDNYFHAESTTDKNLVVTSKSLLPEQINGLEQTPTTFCEANICKIHEDAETEILHSQEQTSPIFFQAAASPDHFLSRYAVDEDVTSVNIATNSHYKLDDSLCDSYLMKDSSIVDRTGIRIRSRHPQNEPGSVNFANQGTTSRRIRLLIESGSSSVHREKSKDVNSDTEHELHSRVTETSKDIDKTSKSDEPEGTVFDKTGEIAQTCDPRLELPMKHADEKGGPKMAFMSSATLFIRKVANYLNMHVVSIFLVIILSVVFLGMWKCPSLPAAYG